MPNHVIVPVPVIATMMPRICILSDALNGVAQSFVQHCLGRHFLDSHFLGKQGLPAKRPFHTGMLAPQ
jgi:hypothetical protein